MGYSFSRREVSRERVVGLTLIDIFIQLIFLLLGILLYIYADDFSIEKWEKFSRDGRSVYGADFSESWEKIPSKIKEKGKGDTPGAVIVRASAPGLVACLDKTSQIPSAKFRLTENGIVFLGFTPKFFDYIKSNHPDRLPRIHELTDSRRTYQPDQLRAEFSVLRVPGCQNFSSVDVGQPELWVTGSKVKYYDQMKAVAFSVGRH